jgi:hypothetical protein
MNEFDDPKYVDNRRNYISGAKAPKGAGFAERVTLPQNNITAPPVRGNEPLTKNPHQHGGPSGRRR